MGPSDNAATAFPVTEQPWKLVADVGGTNARFGLAREVDGSAAVEEIHTLRCADFESLEQAARAYLESIPAAMAAAVGEACIAVAGPIDGDRVAVTNLPWRFSGTGLASALGYSRVALLNDFAALAMACPGLDGTHLERIDNLTGPLPEHEPVRAVVGPGTGLGVCGLQRTATGWEPRPGEGGHASIAPATDEEFAIIRYLHREFEHVSAEHLLSGPGLENIYRSLVALRDVQAPQRTAADISTAALVGDCQLAGDAVETFCGLLGSFCGDVALVMGARGGLYLGGGIPPKIRPLLVRSDFERRLRAKGPMSAYLENLPVYLVSHPFPALHGAADYLGGQK
ncbi:glucokinase [Microbulbifer yueqingensis]|uniref:glucokinase n=1 Tax=Microbulbifer yueqingensis TaxID=658219 RepID=UPI001587BAE1|nr:glucokinase [Microbulbifer yueqingensis]